MEKITRKDAAIISQTTYFTGEPCKRKHIAYRYVKNGACSDCVKSANGVQIGANLAERKAATASMLTIKLRGFIDDRDILAASAYGLACMRSPVLLEGDVDPKLAPQGREPAGTALFSFLCFQEDIDTLRQIADALTSGRRINIEAARTSAFNEAMKWA